jgi:hypothetical protein
MATNNTNNKTNIESQSHKKTYDNDTGSFDDNNISQHVLCTSRYMHITPHSYLLCIPRIPYTATKMDVARAVENQILSLGKGRSAEIENFKYVKNVTFIRAFDQFDFDQLRAARLNAELYGSETSCSTSAYGEPWYKIAFVNVDIPPQCSENEIQFYTNGEDAFYNGVCRGDIVINSWPNAFFVAHPRTYFQQQEQQQQQQQHQTQSKKKSENPQEKVQTQENAFQTWKYEFKLRQLERKVKEHENTIRQYELDTIRHQNVVNEYAESMRFLTRQRLDSPELHGLNCASNGLTSYLPALNNRYSRVCVSDTTFLEVNRNMKLKQMNGYAITACDDCDACQEMIHSIDHTRPDERDQLFAQIEQTICRVNKGVQLFNTLHVVAERSLFGLRNRKVLEDFGAYLSTALEIMEEVTSRVSTFTQDLEYAKCYGQLFRDHHHASTSSTYNYGYDYSEDVDQIYGEDNDNTGIESTQQMLHYFDEHNQELYKQQQQEQQQQEQSESSLGLLTGGGVYHEEAVIIEGEEDAANGSETVAVTAAATTTATVIQETQQNKKSSWLSSWF